jgi:hypothetical protein
MTRKIGVNWRKCPTLALLIALLLSALMPPKAARSQSDYPVSYTFEECEQIKEASLRDELNSITQAVFAEEQGGIDLVAIVDRNWVALNLDATVDKAVADATKQVGDEEGLWGRIISGWSPAKAEELTEKIAALAFGSPAFRNAIDQLSLDITADLVSEIRLMTAKSASSALLCVQQFIGDTVSPTMAAVLEKDIQAKLTDIEFSADEDLDLLDVVKANPNLAGGVAVIIGTQIARSLGKQLAQKIAGRVVGRILARLASGAIPLVGWVVGAGLIVWDLFNAKEGSLPQIRDALQHPEVKEEIRAQVAGKVGDELRTELPQLARSVSNDVFSQWQEFRRKYARLLELAETNTRFKGILNDTPVAEVKKLAEFVAVLEAKLGKDRFERLIDSGQFERLLGLPQKILEMLELGVDPDGVIAWADLAGELIDQVVTMELYRVASPTDFTDRADLEQVLALEDAKLIQKVMLLDRDVRDAVLGMPSAHVKQILEALSVEDLSWLSRTYLANLEAQERNILVERILSEPELISELKSALVQMALLESQEFEETLNYITQKTRDEQLVGRVIDMLAMLGPAISGELSWRLFWLYDGVVLRNVLYAFAVLIVLTILWRKTISRRQRQDVNVTVILPENSGDIGGNSETKRIESRGSEENEK